MELQTKLKLLPNTRQPIDYNSKVVLVGSCFSEHIAKKLDYYKFQNLSNPFGTLFQPLAIEKLILNAINDHQYTEDDIFFLNERWHCFDAHSLISHSDKETFLAQLNAGLQGTKTCLQQATHIIITLGTAWVYRHISEDTIVANCHKVPQKQFIKELLPISAIAESLQAIIALVKDLNPNARIIFTVSPVRHLKDGFIENTRSKSHLIAAVHDVVDERKGQYYFPSYEIQLDELRDYRFFESDMVHPNDLAINYIWERFQSVWLSEATKETMTDIDFIQKGLQHRPFNPNSEAHQSFLQTLQRRKTQVESRFSHIVF